MSYKWNIFTNNFDLTGSSSSTSGIDFISDADGNETDGGAAKTVTFISSVENISIVVDSLTNEIDINIAGTFKGSGVTIGDTVENIIVRNLGSTFETFQVEASVKALEIDNELSAGYKIDATFRSDGATATLVGQQDIFNEDTALATADAYFIVLGNSIILQVLGTAGQNLLWNAEIKIS